MLYIYDCFMLVYMNVSCKLTFVKVCSSTEPRGRTRRATDVSMVEFSCCWNHNYINMIESRPYCPTGFSANWVLFFSPKFFSFISSAKIKRSIMKKNLINILCLEFATEKMIHWMWWIRNSILFWYVSVTCQNMGVKRIQI